MRANVANQTTSLAATMPLPEPTLVIGYGNVLRSDDGAGVIAATRLAEQSATPQVVGAYLAACGEGYAMSTLRRRVAAIARASGALSAPLDTRHPHIRETLRGIGVEYGAPARQAAALTTDEIRRLTEDKAFDIAPMRADLGVDPMPLEQGLALTFPPPQTRA